jgi:2'-5' RNA ligase
MLRLFLAAELSEALRRRIATAIDTIKGEGVPPVKWLPQDNYHITLRFLGDTAEDQLPALERLVSSAAGELLSASVRAGDAGCFPSCKRPRVLYVAVEDAPGRLTEWQRFLESALEKDLGLPPEDRPFRPHITAGYARERKKGDRELVQAAVGRLGQLVTVEPEELSKIVLFQSELGPKGAVHTPIYSVELKKRG